MQYYYGYVLQSVKKRKNEKSFYTGWYTGYTHDLRKRFNEHQNNKSTYTKGRGPFKLLYYEASLHEEDAKAREKYLKSGMGKRYLKNRVKRSLSLTG